VPGARLTVRHGGRAVPLVADDKGYFEVDLRPAPPLPDEGGLHTVSLRLDGAATPAGEAEAGDATDGLVMLPSPRARFGVVSDIDDTVVRTHVHNRLRMLLTLARTNAHTRQPFEGVAALYRALQAGAGGDDGNPLFYVSSSPWNLYTPLVEYLQAQDIPLGPLLLKDYGDHSLARLHDHRGHKQAAIERVLDTYPALPFVLIGDSSEQDPEIYAAIAAQRPQRVRAVYIRSPRVDARRQAAVQRLAESLRPLGVPMRGVADSVAAARHAAELGLINADAVASVQADRRRDLASPA
jgi:phosphatidate phosphatase APP1